MIDNVRLTAILVGGCKIWLVLAAS